MQENDKKSYYKQLYDFAIEQLLKKYTSYTVNLWFEPMKVFDVTGNTVTISLPMNRKLFVEKQFMDALKQVFSDLLGVEAEIKLISEEEEAALTDERVFDEEEDGEEEIEEFEDKPRSEYKLRYDPEYTFENFVVGKSNQLAHAVSYSVANRPSDLYNPLFLYGNSGLGKTHLMFAIIDRIRKNFPNYKILYVTGEEFTNELVESLAAKQGMAFRKKYRNLDVLVIDDVQFIAGKLTTEEEFFHTFEALFNMRKQIIIASDRPPTEISNLTERLKTRFAMGMIADIQPPDKELRMAIFKRKAEDYNLELTMDVLFYLADNITQNIRLIEGSLKRLKAYSIIHGEKVTLQTAKDVLSDFFKNSQNKESTTDRIFEAAEKRYGVKKEDILSSKRNAEIVMARHYSIYLLRMSLGLTYDSIAKTFNKKDHTTIINSIRTVERKIKKDPAFEREINKMIAELRS